MFRPLFEVLDRVASLQIQSVVFLLFEPEFFVGFVSWGQGKDLYLHVPGGVVGLGLLLMSSVLLFFVCMFFVCSLRIVFCIGGRCK